MRLPYKFPIKPVGDYELAAFDSGLALYQFGRLGPYYNVSPLNDYVIDSNNLRQILLPYKDYTEKKFTTANNPQYIKILDVVKSFLGREYIVYHISYMGNNITYQGDVNGNQVEILRKIELGTPAWVNDQGMTLAGGADDVVFNPVTGVVYSKNSPQTIELINQVYQLQLVSAGEGEGETQVPEGVVGIVNPKIPGVIVVEAVTGQTITVDRNFNLVAIQQRVGEVVKNLEMKLIIKIGKNIKVASSS
jgi:hypothetical protein